MITSLSPNFLRVIAMVYCSCRANRPPARLVLFIVFLLLPMPQAKGAEYSHVAVKRCARSLDAWQLEDAIACAAHALMQNPNDASTQALAAEVLHQRGQHLEAMALLGTQAQTPADRRLQQFLPQLRGSAHYAATFETLTTRHFRIRYQNKDLLMAHYAQDVLEAAYARIGADLDARVSEGDEPITVEIYPTLKALAQATGLTEQEIEKSGTIAVCKFHRLMVISALATATGYSWADTLAHELTHLMISKRSHNHVPIWLHEGIAKYFETRWRGEAGLGLTAYGEGLLSRAAQDSTFIPFARMHPSMAKLPNQHDASLAFAEVFAMVQMLVQERGPKVIATVLRRLGEGVPFDTVLKTTLGHTLEELEQRLHKALKKRPPRSAVAEAAPLRLAPMAQAASAATPAPLAPGALDDDAQARGLLRLGELLALQGHAVAAIDPWQRAHTLAGTRLPQLGLRLAQALAQTDQPARAEAIITATLAAHPDLIEGQKLLAELLLARKAYAQVLAPVHAYCLHNPFDPAVHALWAEAAEARGDKATAIRERRFVALSEAPRQVSDAPAPAVGPARLRVITEPWGSLFIDDSTVPIVTPAWDVPVSLGPHKLRVETRRGQTMLGSEGVVDSQQAVPTLWRAHLAPVLPPGR